MTMAGCGPRVGGLKRYATISVEPSALGKNTVSGAANAGVVSIASITGTTSFVGRFAIWPALEALRAGNARMHGKARRTRLVELEAPSYGFRKIGERKRTMKQL